MSNQHLPTNTPQPIRPNDQICRIILARQRPHLGRVIKIDVRYLRVDDDVDAQLDGAFEERTVEIGAVGVPIRVPVFLDDFGQEIGFAEDFSVAVVPQDKRFGVDAVFFEFGGYAPAFQQPRGIGGDLDPCSDLLPS